MSLTIGQNGNEVGEADKSRDENGYWQTSDINKGREATRLRKTTLEITCMESDFRQTGKLARAGTVCKTYHNKVKTSRQHC